MAQLKEKFFGKISGTFGDYIGVIRGNNNYIIRKKANRKVDTSPAGIERRNRFRTAIKASKAINSIPVLNYIWDAYSDEKLSAYNYCIKRNYKHISGSGTTAGFSLLPGTGFAFSFDTYTRDENGINLTLLPLVNSTDFNTSVETKIAGYFLIELNDPGKSDTEKVLFIPRESDSQVLDLDNPLSFGIDFKQTDSGLISGYPTVKVHLAFCTFNDLDEPVQFSSTLMHE